MATIRTAIQLQDGVTSVVRPMVSAINVCTNSFEALQSVANHAMNTNNISAARSSIVQTSAAIDNVERNIHEATAAQQRFNAELKNSHGAADGLVEKFKSIAAAIATVTGAKQVMNLSDNVAQTTARLDLMNDKHQSTAQLQEMIFASAERSRGVYLGTANAVAQLGNQAKNAFSSNAELIAFSEQLNKNFIIAGTNQEGVASATLQLTQGLASGVLRGEELNAVFENAQPIIQHIADYMKVDVGQIRAMAQEGQITASIVKNALLSATDETNAKFATMPKTFAQVWTSIENNAIRAFQPLLKMVNNIANSSGVTNLVNGTIGGLNLLGSVATSTFMAVSNTIVWGMQAAGSMMQFLGNVILGIMPFAISGLAAYGSYWLVTNANMIVNSAISAAVAARTWLIVTAQSAWAAVTQGVIAAQRMLNLVLSMNPLGFVITLVATVIAFFGTWQVVTYGLRNTFADVFGFIVDTVQSAVNLIVSSINTVVRSFNAIGGFVGKIMGFEYSNIAEIAYRADFSGVKAAGQNFIKEFSMDSLFKAPNLQVAGYDPSTIANIADTAANTGKMKDSLDITAEDLKYLRDIAEQEVINRFTTADIHLTMSNNNTINSNVDLDGVVTYMKDTLIETMQVAAEKVHKD